MLDKYMDGQPVVYRMLMNAINNNKLSHAYLFDANGNSDVYDIVLSFVKMIVSKDSEIDINDLSKRIDDGNYLDVKVIEPDGLWIKKDQVLELEEEFNKKAIEGKKKIYIIKSADKMNSSTANSILKFLEEPVDDIIAFLIVDNISLVLPTIVSRCQVLRLNRKNYENSTLDNFNNLFFNSKLDVDSKKVFIDNVINFINYLESNGLDTIIYSKRLWHNNFKNRDECVMALELIINYYYDVIKYKTLNKIDFFKDRERDINNIASNNDLNDLTRKLSVCIEIKSYFMNNLNINLTFDRFVIEMCGD